MKTFQEALKIALQMVFTPEATWNNVVSIKSDKLYKEFLLPLWLIITFTSFIGGWIISEAGTIESGIKAAIIEIILLFISFQIASFSLNEHLKKHLKHDNKIIETQVFVAYSSSLIYLLDLLVTLVNDFFFLWLFSIYTFYIIYIGTDIYYKVTTDQRLNFTIVASLLIMGIPLAVKYLFSLLISI